MKTLRSSRRAERGSLLIVAMILSAVIAISVTSYLQLGRTGMTISTRALYNNASMNLAENGLEQAVYAVNKTVADATYDWASNGWTVTGSSVKQKWTGTALGQGATGEVRTWIDDKTSPAPKIVTRSIVTLGNGGKTLEKWVEVSLRKTSKFSNGLVAKQTITFNGNNASVDSWDSNSDTATTADDVAYSATSKRANGSVGSISVSVSAVAVNNADIFGYASTGGALPSVGTNGLIGAFGAAAGSVDMSRVSTDFSASFDAVTAPTTYSYNLYGGAITADESLPRSGTDTVAADGYYYISADSVNYNNKVLTITDKVVLKLTNTMTGIDIGGGSGALNITGAGELIIYTSGDIKIAGNGVMNGGTTAATAKPPAKFQIYGTKTSGVQDIQIAGNGVLSGIVYAPQGSVKINGNGDVLGSVVANDITAVGNAAFHYDESLANFGGNNPYRVSKWKELTSASDRSTYSSTMSW
jgi:hypothetical protein